MLLLHSTLRVSGRRLFSTGAARFQGKTVLLTGGAGDIGRAATKIFVE